MNGKTKEASYSTIILSILIQHRQEISNNTNVQEFYNAITNEDYHEERLSTIEKVKSYEITYRAMQHTIIGKFTKL